MTSAGSIFGSIRISAKQAIAEYAAVRVANATTRTSLMASSAVFARVGIAALAAAAPIALLFKHAITAAADFEKKIDYFGAVTGASQKDMQAVADKAMQMGRTTVFSAQDMADAFVEFGKAGINTKDIINGVADATANLAQAADISIAESSNIMAAQLATFRLGAAGAGHVADVLAGAANASIIDVQDLAYSLKYAGGIASTTGISFDSLVTAISLLGQRGIRGSTAGTSLRQIMVSLTGTTSKATKELKALGIITDQGSNKFIDQTGHLKNLSTVFQILQDAERGYTDAQQLAINKNIFNTRALSAVQILMKDGAKGFVDMQNSINKVTASDVAKKRLDNLAGDWRRLKNSIQTLLIQVGGPLQNFLRNIVQGLTGLVRWFANLSPHMQNIIFLGLGLFGAFLIILGVLSLMIALVLKTISVYKELKAAFLLVRGAVLAFSASFRAAAVALLTNPIFLIIAGLALLVIGLIYCWNHFKGFRDFIKDAWAKIKGFFIGAWGVIKDILRFIVDTAKATADGFMKYFVHPIEAAWDAVVNAFKSAYRFVSNIITTLVGFIREHWKAIIAIIGLLLGPIFLVMALAIDAITTHWHSIVKFLTMVWKGIVTFAKFIFNALLSYFRFVFNIYKTVIETAWNIIKTIVLAIWNAIVAAAKAVWGALTWFFQGLWNVIVGIFTTAANFVATVLKDAWDLISGPLHAFWNGVKHFFSTIWTGIKVIFSNAWKVISGMLGAIWRNIGVPLKNAATAIWNGIQSVISKVWNTLSGVASTIWHAFDSLYDNMLKVGKNLIVGIWNGIAGLADWLWNKVSSFISNLWNSIMDFFGIHSPATKGIFAGEMIVRGIAKGIDNQKKNAVKAITDVNAAMAAAHNSALNTQINTQFAGLTAQSNAAMANGTAQKNNSGFYVEKLEVNNPVAETASDSLPRTIRKINYMTAGPAR